ncbi:MAG: glycoside hydrolase family 3 N-terminal domain-containing protein [Mycoplasmatales bacterium]
MQTKQLKELISQMTIEEKIGQLAQITGDFFDTNAKITGPMQTMDLTEKEITKVGSVIGILDYKKVKQIQDMYLAKSRLKIPLIFMSDVIHGANTIFPIPLGLSSAFNEDLIYEVAKISGKEAAIQGCNVTFSPMADLAFDARWGRNMEGNGEDPYLNERLTQAYVRGYQQKDKQGNLQLASCLKHFAGYGLVHAGREYNTVDISQRFLKEYHYPAYKSGIDAGAKMVMTAFNTINSIPAVSNESLLKRDLRQNMNFDYPIISDWGAISELIYHKVAQNKKEAALQAFKASCDIDMMTSCYQKELPKLIDEGLCNEADLDKAVYRLLNLKNELGLFENPYGQIDEEACKNFILSMEIKNKAKEAADESVVLLKNEESILPVKNEEKVIICGPLSNTKELMGPWSIYGDVSAISSIKEYFTKQNKNIKYIDYEQVLQNIELIKGAKKVIFFGGETSFESGEAHSKTNINIEQKQLTVLKQIKTIVKDIVFVNFSGRPLILSEINIYCQGILQAWFLGTMTAQSLYDIIYGNINPSGKLTMSFPRTVGHCPISYRDYPTGRPKEYAIDEYTSKYIDCLNEPLFPFGHGLSYANIQINKIVYDKEEFKKNEKIIIQVEVENLSKISAKQTLQLYINDLVADVIRPRKELKSFKKFKINKLIKKEIIFEINKEMLKYINQNGEEQIDTGDFEIMIGFDSTNVQTQKIKLIK